MKNQSYPIFILTSLAKLENKCTPDRRSSIHHSHLVYYFICGASRSKCFEDNDENEDLNENNNMAVH